LSSSIELTVDGQEDNVRDLPQVETMLSNRIDELAFDPTIAATNQTVSLTQCTVFSELTIFQKKIDVKVEQINFSQRQRPIKMFESWHHIIHKIILFL